MFQIFGRRKIQIFLERIEEKLINEKKSEEKSELNCLDTVSKYIKEIKGDKNIDYSITEIWSKENLKIESNVDKFNFLNLLNFLLRVEQILIKENKEFILDQLFKEKNKNRKELIQQILFIDELELQNSITEKIIGNEAIKDEKKRELIVQILIKFDFILKRDTRKEKTKQKEKTTKKYLVPIFFPNEKPKSIVLFNPENQLENGKEISLITKKIEWNINYYLPFKPSALWKIFFITLRNIFISSENVNQMLTEFYWLDGKIILNN